MGPPKDLGRISYSPSSLSLVRLQPTSPAMEPLLLMSADVCRHAWTRSCCQLSPPGPPGPQQMTSYIMCLGLHCSSHQLLSPPLQHLEQRPLASTIVTAPWKNGNKPLLPLCLGQDQWLPTSCVVASIITCHAQPHSCCQLSPTSGPEQLSCLLPA